MIRLLLEQCRFIIICARVGQKWSLRSKSVKNLNQKSKERTLISQITRMTQEERWLVRYNEVVAFVEANHRNPSKHRIEEHDMLNWLKATRKRMNAGDLKPERVELFEKLLKLMELYKGRKHRCWCKVGI